MKQTVGLQCEPQTAMELYWDNHLTPSDENPYPLAPPDANVTPESYIAEEGSLINAGKVVMIPEIARICGEPGFNKGPKGIDVLGAGLLRDLHWVSYAANMPFSPITIVDSSMVAYYNIRNFVEKYQLHFVDYKHKDVMEAIKCGDILTKETLVVYLSMLAQNMKEGEKSELMQFLGSFLRRPTGKGRRRRRVYLLHPRGEDNPPESVKWRNTIPYFDAELRDPIEKGFGGPVQMDIIAQHMYFHQKYSFIRFMGEL